jgi:malate dehydrogenase (oxaloacetate-decarboxylating)
MPPLQAVQTVSRVVAEAVARAAVREGLARHAASEAEALARLEACTWRPAYPPVLAG